jgi:hypothetical protein
MKSWSIFCKKARKDFSMANKKKLSFLVILSLASSHNLWSMEQFKGSLPAIVGSSAFVIGGLAYCYDSYCKRNEIQELKQKLNELHGLELQLGMNTPQGRATIAGQLFSTAMQGVDLDIKKHGGAIQVLQADVTQMQNFLKTVFSEGSDGNTLPAERSLEEYLYKFTVRESMKGLPKATESGGVYSSLGLMGLEEKGKTKGESKD